MAELAGHNGAATTGNPITTNSKALFAVPSKQSETHCNGNGCTTELHYYDSTDTQDNGALVGSGGETSSSSSSSESEGSDEESSEEEEEEVSDEVALKQAGVELDWDMLGTPAQSGGMAPTQLLSEVLHFALHA